MKDPTRLLDAAEPTDPVGQLELRLLRAGASEQPPTAAVTRLARRLDFAPQPTAAPAFSLLKLGVLTIGLAVAGVVWVSFRSQQPPAPPAPPPVEQHAAPTLPAPSSEPSAEEPTVDARSLALEIARIDAVRQLLAKDHAKSAIAALQAYQRDFPGGVLHQEADVLGIEAQQRAGDRRRARALATSFLAKHPDSPHNAHVRELLEALGPDAR